MARARLPNRPAHELRDLDFNGKRFPVVFITPPTWKRAVGIPPGKDGAKDAARSEAIRRWPDKANLFARGKDDGRAEAALIAVAGMQKEAAHRE